MIECYKMWTRSKNILPKIDFDEASREWIKNKKKIGNGMYVYILVKKESLNK